MKKLDFRKVSIIQGDREIFEASPMDIACLNDRSDVVRFFLNFCEQNSKLTISLQILMFYKSG